MAGPDSAPHNRVELHLEPWCPAAVPPAWRRARRTLQPTLQSPGPRNKNPFRRGSRPAAFPSNSLAAPLEPTAIAPTTNNHAQRANCPVAWLTFGWRSYVGPLTGWEKRKER